MYGGEGMDRWMAVKKGFNDSSPQARMFLKCLYDTYLQKIEANFVVKPLKGRHSDHKRPILLNKQNGLVYYLQCRKENPTLNRLCPSALQQEKNYRLALPKIILQYF